VRWADEEAHGWFGPWFVRAALQRSGALLCAVFSGRQL
jgi:hypothetical protein